MENQPRGTEQLHSAEAPLENVTEQEVDQSIIENPQGFVSWFENLKDSIIEWPEKFFTEKMFRNAILMASIPVAVLKAGQLEASAADLTLNPVELPAASKNIEEESVPKRIKSEELIFQEEPEHREIVAQRLNYELDAFDKLSKPFNDVVGAPIFDFSGRMTEKLQEVNRFSKELSESRDKESTREKETHRILENGRLNFTELVKFFPEVLHAQKISVLVHETGHATEAHKQGASSTSVRINLFGGYTEYTGNIGNKAAFSAAGINADKSYGEFLVNSLREKDAPSQLSAVMALVAKSDGLYYALSTSLSTAKRNAEGNDIVAYAKETNTPVSDLAVGLAAEFLSDRDNWQLLKAALGEEGVKIPESTLSPMYELSPTGPRIGVKFRGIF